MTYGLMLGSCIFCTVLTLAVYGLSTKRPQTHRKKNCSQRYEAAKFVYC